MFELNEIQSNHYKKQVSMIDIQNKKDNRGIEIQRVGVKNVHLPFFIKTQIGEYQQVQGIVTLTVNLPPHYKGTHLSRFMELLMSWSVKPISGKDIFQLLNEVCKNLKAAIAEVSLKFRYFLPVEAPISRIIGHLDYIGEFRGSLNQATGLFDYQLGAEIPVLSLCPCSKEISQFGAHNQRAVIRTLVRFNHPGRFLWLEELINLLRNQGSCPVSYHVFKSQRPESNGRPAHYE